MPKKTDKKSDSDLEKENIERVNKVAAEIIEPAIRQAVLSAEKIATPIEVVSALSNVYGSLLIDLFGKQTALSIMKDHYEHLAVTENHSVNTRHS
jgi:hypothetical protein